ncbi:suppressor APC domain-containing protein 2-like [Paramormyrops kingsleyae]
MKELEQEKDSLLAGLDVIERAREWYQNQIQNVAEKQRQMGQTNPSTDLFPESGQGRLNLLLPKLQDVNRCLSDLISCSGMPITSHGAPPPAIPLNPQPPPPTAPNAIQRLKDQNRLLTQEVTEKSERITQLEQEKSALIKQLFEARARSAHDNSTLDSTFI